MGSHSTVGAGGGPTIERTALRTSWRGLDSVLLEDGEAPVRERLAASLPREHGVEVAVELNEPFVEGDQRAGFQELLYEFDVSRARRRGRRRRRASGADRFDQCRSDLGGSWHMS